MHSIDPIFVESEWAPTGRMVSVVAALSQCAAAMLSCQIALIKLYFQQNSTAERGVFFFFQQLRMNTTRVHIQLSGSLVGSLRLSCLRHDSALAPIFSIFQRRSLSNISLKALAKNC
jgi:hypothetical protein